MQRELTLKDGIALAIGSIIGSGILFLPSLTAEISGIHTSSVWILTTVLCVPLLFIFADMVKDVQAGSGVEGFVSLGLGKNIGAAIPILFLGTISFGMPSSAIIVGEYVKTLFQSGHSAVTLVAFALVLIGTITNLIGIKIASSFQLLIALVTLVMGASVYFVVQPEIPWHDSLSISNITNLDVIIPGVLIAFWAYAGFENMTFIAAEFKNPKRDFQLSMIIALLVCGLLYWILSLSYYAVAVPGQEATFSGLLQIAQFSNHHRVLNVIITLFAFLAVQINFNSWIWGISRLVYSSAKQGKLPQYLGTLNNKQIPARAVLLLAMIFTGVLILSIYFVNFLDFIVPIVSTNFIFIYLLCLLSYIRFKKIGLLRNIAIVLFLLLLPVIISAGWAILYPIFLSCCGLIYYNRSENRRRRLSIPSTAV